MALTSTNHPPDIRNDADAKDARITLEISDRELGSSSVTGAGIDILDLDGARFQHGNESLDSQSTAIARDFRRMVDEVSSDIGVFGSFNFFLEVEKLSKFSDGFKLLGLSSVGLRALGT